MVADSNEYFRQLLQRVDQAVKVPFRAVSHEGWQPEPNKCHENVDCWVKHHPQSSAARGWMFWPSVLPGRYEFRAHSVVEEDGGLFDITPM